MLDCYCQQRGREVTLRHCESEMRFVSVAFWQPPPAATIRCTEVGGNAVFLRAHGRIMAGSSLCGEYVEIRVPV
jgi:hypothetical protein